MVAKKGNLPGKDGKGKKNQEAQTLASYIRTGAHGDYRNRRVSIGSRSLEQVEVYRKYYNMVRYELYHKIIVDWAKRYWPDNRLEFVDYQFSQPGEVSGFMAVMYDSDYEIVENFSKIFGNRKAASAFAKIVDWWVTENQDKPPLAMRARTKKK
jgi:hypothetical protein